jgi:dihydrolipoamide dehydrogenase
MSKKHDVIVVGAGPAGYVAAIRCAQLGLKTVCVDEWLNDDGKPALGGTCLNVGCIPSKVLLESSEQYVLLKEQFGTRGIRVAGIELDLDAMLAHKQRIVRTLTDGVAQLFKANGVEWKRGNGRLLDGKRIEVTPHDGKPSSVLEGENVILATGSRPIEIQAAPLDGEHIVDSAGALAFTQVPRRLGVIGAGVIGLEMGSVWRRLGSDVVLLEAQDTFLAPVDQEIAKDALRQFGKQGLEVRLNTRVLNTEVTGDGVRIDYRESNGEQSSITVDRLIVAVGRRPYTDGLLTAESELLLDERGYIDIDEHWRTNLPGVYAVGDVVRGPMLAHKGSEEGIAVAETIAGHAGHVNYETIPWVIYTDPEIAWVGATEEALKASGTRYRSGVFPFAANGRALALGSSAGRVKILADAETDRVLGVHVVGASASELIAECVLAMEFSASAEDIARTVHAHPTLAEAIHEAALAVDGRPIHIAGKRRKG